MAYLLLFLMQLVDLMCQRTFLKFPLKQFGEITVFSLRVRHLEVVGVKPLLPVHLKRSLCGKDVLDLNDI